MQRCSLEPWQKCAMQKCGQLEREWLVTPCVARISLIDGCYSASQSLGNYSFHGFSEELSDLHNFFLAEELGAEFHHLRTDSKTV